MNWEKCILCLILTILLCTGCDIKYELKISDKMLFDEKITAIDNQKYTEEADSYTVYSYKDLYGTLYEINSNREENKYQLFLSSSRTVLGNNYMNQYFSQAIERNKNKIIITATPTDLFISLMTDKDVIEAEVDTVTVNVISEKKVISHNADSVKENTYTWIYEKNKHYKPLEITLENNQKQKIVTPKKKNNDTYFIIAGIILIILTCIIIYKQYIKSIKNNQL